jgi:hypothetical protein
MAFSGRAYVNVGSKILRDAYLSVVVCTQNTLGRSHPSLSCHVIYATLTLCVESLSWYSSGTAGESYNKGKAVWIFMPRSEKAFSGIISARHTLFDLPPEEAMFWQPLLSIQWHLAAILKTCLKSPLGHRRTSLPFGDVLAVDKIALANQPIFRALFSQGPKWTVKLEHVGNRRLGVQSAV